MDRHASKTWLVHGEPFPRAAAPNFFSMTFSFSKSSFQGILLDSSFSLETLSTPKATASLSALLSSFSMCAVSPDISGSYPLSREGLGEIGTHTLNHLYPI